MKIAAFLLLLFTTRIATADEVILESVCAVVEPSDILDEDSREAARRLLVRTLERADQWVVERDCTVTFRVGHVRIDGVVVVRIAGPHSVRRWSNATPEKLPLIYESLVRALLTERPAVAPAIPTPVMPDTEPANETRATKPPPAPFPIPTTEAAPGTIARGGLWTLRAGLGGISDLGSVTTGAIGYRRNLGEYAVDAALIGAGVGGNGGESSGSSGKLAMQVLKFRRPERATSYCGGGMSLGSTTIQQMGFGQATGGGLGLEFAVGYAFARTSRTFQSFAQADLSLPLYNVTGASGSSYPATFVATFGIAFGSK